MLLDVSMPDMDGFETRELIHEHPRFERTPIIFVTGVHITELDRLQGLQARARSTTCSIPVVPEILRSKVAVLVELYCKRRELQRAEPHPGARQRAAVGRPTSRCRRKRPASSSSLNATLQRANAELEAANRRAAEGSGRARPRRAGRFKEADRHKDEFLAMLAHELRNPLAPILNAAAADAHEACPRPQLDVGAGGHRAAARRT